MTGAVSPPGSCLTWGILVQTDCLQITASALGLGVDDILCASFQDLVFISYSLVGLPKVSPASPSKSNVLGAHLLGAKSQSWGTQCGAWIPCSLERT